MLIQGLGTFVQTIPETFVQTIWPAGDALSVEGAVELFSAAFEQVCAMEVVDKLVVNSLIRELTAAEATAVLEKRERLSRKALVLASS